ncbi:MAG: GIY-YIG nuclease family protein [Gemmatimonadales bacterium]|nr:GIY-YIG nuclease family protein [Gemmatimonadales bacterium]
MPIPHFVYILTNQAGCYYVGMTRDMRRRWHEHRDGALGAEFTRTFHVTRLVYVMPCVDFKSARQHEASLKRRTRARKAAIIRVANPEMRDLAVGFGWRRAPASAMRWEWHD